MTSTECLTKEQLDDVRRETKLSDRNNKLLDMLTRRSREHFDQFVKCVEETQPHIVSLLAGISGMCISRPAVVYTVSRNTIAV